MRGITSWNFASLDRDLPFAGHMNAEHQIKTFLDRDLPFAGHMNAEHQIKTFLDWDLPFEGQMNEEGKNLINIYNLSKKKKN